ncbi:D-lactate dehydrogenase [Candidatus Hepatincola sp. Pdp]
MVKVYFFGTKNYVRDSFNSLNQQNFNFTLTYDNSNINVNTAKLANGYDAICVFVNDVIDTEVIKVLKQNGVKMIALRCAGFNNVDFSMANKEGIVVVRVPVYSPYAVAEHAFALILSLNRKIHKAYNRVREGNFDISGLLGFDLHGKNIGVIGTGNIGEKFLRIAKGFGLNSLAYDIYPNKELAKEIGFTYTDLKTIYKEADIIALHCPLSKDNYHLINKDTIKQMKDGVMLINTSRGGLIATNDLVDAMKTGKVGSVALDVYEKEADYFFQDLSHENIDDDTLARLLTFNNVLVTSHQAFFTQEALANIASVTLGNIHSYFIKNKLINDVK